MKSSPAGCHGPIQLPSCSVNLLLRLRCGQGGSGAIRNHRPSFSHSLQAYKHLIYRLSTLQLVSNITFSSEKSPSAAPCSVTISSLTNDQYQTVINVDYGGQYLNHSPAINSLPRSSSRNLHRNTRPQSHPLRPPRPGNWALQDLSLQPSICQRPNVSRRICRVQYQCGVRRTGRWHDLGGHATD